MRFILFFSVVLHSLNLFAQGASNQFDALEKELQLLDKQRSNVLLKIEEAKLEKLRNDLYENGLPALEANEERIDHSAMSLVYSEEHEQAKWVAHIITADVINGKTSRTNDFRSDPKVKTGTAEEKDYFLKYPKGNGEFNYDGFGYDRGHLAPSADFRWSAKALSESYFYSNMSPQVASFNREKWADLEGALRGYLYRNPDTQLYVCTGAVLTDALPKIERSVNKVSIPEQYWKVVIDLKNERGIAFLMDNRDLQYPVYSYIKTIDEIEALTGIDFFAGVADDLEGKLEANSNKSVWFSDEESGVEPIPMSQLPKRHYNTVAAGKLTQTGTEVTVCGQVVGARRSRKGNILLNLDRPYPNQIFTVFIRKEDISNFPYDPEEALKGKILYVKGTVAKMGSTPCIYLKKEEYLTVMD